MGFGGRKELTFLFTRNGGEMCVQLWEGNSNVEFSILKNFVQNLVKTCANKFVLFLLERERQLQEVLMAFNWL